MNVIDVDIDWKVNYANRPVFKLVVDRIPLARLKEKTIEMKPKHPRFGDRIEYSEFGLVVTQLWNGRFWEVSGGGYGQADAYLKDGNQSFVGYVDPDWLRKELERIGSSLRPYWNGRSWEPYHSGWVKIGHNYQDRSWATGKAVRDLERLIWPGSVDSDPEQRARSRVIAGDLARFWNRKTARPLVAQQNAVGVPRCAICKDVLGDEWEMGQRIESRLYLHHPLNLYPAHASCLERLAQGDETARSIHQLLEHEARLRLPMWERRG